MNLFILFYFIELLCACVHPHAIALYKSDPHPHTQGDGSCCYCYHYYHGRGAVGPSRMAPCGSDHLSAHFSVQVGSVIEQHGICDVIHKGPVGRIHWEFSA